VKSQSFIIAEMFINEKMNMIFSVVNQSERTDRSGFYAQVFHKTLVGSKGQLSLPETLLKIMYVELAQMLKDHKIMPVALVIPEEDVLASA
jgi:hypothetical protein